MKRKYIKILKLERELKKNTGNLVTLSWFVYILLILSQLKTILLGIYKDVFFSTLSNISILDLYIIGRQFKFLYLLHITQTLNKKKQNMKYLFDIKRESTCNVLFFTVLLQRQQLKNNVKSRWTLPLYIVKIYISIFP